MKRYFQGIAHVGEIVCSQADHILEDLLVKGKGLG